MVTKKYCLLFSILMQCTLFAAASKPATSADNNFSLNFMLPKALLSATSGSAGSAAAAQPSMSDAGVAVGRGLQLIAEAMTQTPKGVTFPQSLETFAGALRATTEGKPEDSGMRHLAGGLIAVSGALKAMTEGKPEDGGMRHFAGALRETAHGIQNIGLKKETLQEIKKLTEELHKITHRHAIKCIALCGGTASACSIPLYGASLSNVCCLTAALVALRPDTADKLATQYLSTEIGARVARLLDICCENEHAPQQIVAISPHISPKGTSKPETPTMVRSAQPVAVAPADMDSKHLTTPAPLTIKSKSFDQSSQADNKSDPKKEQ